LSVFSSKSAQKNINSCSEFGEQKEYLNPRFGSPDLD
jgi:hypothetical protein